MSNPTPCDKCGCNGEQQYDLVLAIYKDSGNLICNKILDHGPAYVGTFQTKDDLIQGLRSEAEKL